MAKKLGSAVRPLGGAALIAAGAAGIVYGVTLITDGELGGTPVIGFAVAAITLGAALAVPNWRRQVLPLAVAAIAPGAAFIAHEAAGTGPVRVLRIRARQAVQRGSKVPPFS